MNMKTNKTQTCNMTVENNNKTNGADIMNMNKTYNTQIENNTVELSTKTGNGTKFVLVINNRKVYTSEDLTVNNTEMNWLINKYYDGELSTEEVLNKIIIGFNNVVAEAPAPVEGTTDALGITYKAHPNAYVEGYCSGARFLPIAYFEVYDNEEDNDVVEPKATVKPTKGISKVRRESLYDLSGRVHNIAGKLVKAPIMPIAKKVYNKVSKFVNTKLVLGKMVFTKKVVGEDDPGIPLELYLKELEKILAKNPSTILYMYSPTCSYCQKFEPSYKKLYEMLANAGGLINIILVIDEFICFIIEEYNRLNYCFDDNLEYIYGDNGIILLIPFNTFCYCFILRKGSIIRSEKAPEALLNIFFYMKNYVI